MPVEMPNRLIITILTNSEEPTDIAEPIDVKTPKITQTEKRYFLQDFTRKTELKIADTIRKTA